MADTPFHTQGDVISCIPILWSQVRVDGQAVPLDDEELNKYWKDMPRDQQLYFSTKLNNTGGLIVDREVCYIIF